MDTLRLRKSDQEKVLHILRDVEDSVSCCVGIGGSLAQRALSSAVAKSLREQPLHDVDLLLIGTSESAPELPKLRKLFDITEVIHSHTTWYYGMTHKSTGMWVDLFTPPSGQHMVPVQMNGKAYQASSLESQLLYLAQDILRRTNTGYPVRKKWLEKLAYLSALPEIDWELVEAEFRVNSDRHVSVLKKACMHPTSANAYIKQALAQKPTSRLREKVTLAWWYLFVRKNKAN